METDTEQPRADNTIIIEQLEIANHHLARQNSLRHVFVSGIVTGLGFFIGSAIIATIALGVFGPILGKIQWVRSTYEAGSMMRR